MKPPAFVETNKGFSESKDHEAKDLQWFWDLEVKSFLSWKNEPWIQLI